MFNFDVEEYINSEENKEFDLPETEYKCTGDGDFYTIVYLIDNKGEFYKISIKDYHCGECYSCFKRFCILNDMGYFIPFKDKDLLNRCLAEAINYTQDENVEEYRSIIKYINFNTYFVNNNIMDKAKDLPF